MIIEDYISFETAKLLKEKGFVQPTRHYYSYDGRLGYAASEYNWNQTTGHYCDYSCISLQMAMKWLREVHGLHINLDIHWLHFANLNGWAYLIEKILDNGVEYIDSKGDENDKAFYSTYEEACEAAIKYCLENLI